MEISRKTTMPCLYCKARCHGQAGFTLVELMVVIVVIAILSAITVPNIIDWLPNYRLKSAARDLVSNFQKAKMEAVKENTDVIIQFTPGTYLPAGQVGSYKVFVDDAAPGAKWVFDAGEPILAQVNMPKNVSLYTTTFAGDKTGFNSRALPIAPPPHDGNVTIRNNKSRYYKAVLSPVGHIKLRMSSDGINWN
ncbi:MAG: GspH/FimT family pseudopilin [Thermodesulfobacteriota bacterium]|nr:GspH/FimT family pseudopilin [Thermodesulfobacteriota bacterium]